MQFYDRRRGIHFVSRGHSKFGLVKLYHWPSLHGTCRQLQCEHLVRMPIMDMLESITNRALEKGANPSFCHLCPHQLPFLRAMQAVHKI